MERKLQRNNFLLNTIYNKYVAASVLAMLAATMGGMIDTILVGKFLGETGLAAMSLVSPVYLAYYTIGAVIGMGGSIAASLYIGKNDYDAYRRIFTLSSGMTLVVCVIITAAALVFMDPLLTLLGAAGAVRAYAADYLLWYVIGGSGTLLVYIPLNFLKSAGKPQASSMLFLLSSGLNVALTWIFMSPLCNMGMKGASIATGLSMTLTAGLGFYILLRRTPDTYPVKMCPTAGLIREIIACGSPNGCNNLFNALKLLLINGVLLRLGAAAYLPVFSLVKSVSDLILGIMTGIVSALMPIIGVYLGEKDTGSIRRVCHSAIWIGGVFTLGAAALTALFPDMFCLIFNITETTARQGSHGALRCLALSFLPAFPNIMMSGYFNTIQRPVLSNFILFFRLLAFLAPSIMLLASFGGIRGIWWSLAAAELLTLAVIPFAVRGIRKQSPCLDWYLLDTTHEREHEISFSVCNTTEDIMFASNKITDFCESTGISARKTMQVSLALEEMLTVIIQYCMGTKKGQFIDIRIMKMGTDVLLRIRNSGKIFDPVRFYEEHKDTAAMADQILGIKMIIGTAKNIEFRETFGMNNLMIQL